VIICTYRLPVIAAEFKWIRYAIININFLFRLRIYNVVSEERQKRGGGEGRGKPLHPPGKDVCSPGGQVDTLFYG
jgi:hypothetical protein